MYDLDRFGVDDLERFSAEFRRLCPPGGSMEEAAQRIVRHVYEQLGHRGEPATALVRLYKTHPYADLDEKLRAAAAALAPGPLAPSAPCLTLLGTAGLEAAWNDRRRSVGHAAIPLATESALERSPMIAALLADLGVGIDEVVEARPFQLHHHRHHGVFFVEEAAGDPTIPAQDDFVALYGIRSVIGVGGFLPSGDVFALVVFLTAPVRHEVAMMFGTVALSLKASLIPYTYRAFAPEVGSGRT